MPSFKLKCRDHLASSHQKREFNKQLFSTIAQEYPWMTRVLSFGRDAAWKRRLVADLPDLEKPTCADLACGNGDLIRLLRQRYSQADITGVDLTDAMLARARRKLADSRTRFVQRDMMDTGLPTASFDVVTIGYGLRNAPDRQQAMAEIVRLLRPGGTVGILDFSRWDSPGWARAELALLRLWGGFWGLVRTGNPDTYAYIAHSLAQFPSRRQLHTELTEHGLTIRSSRRGFAGIIESLVATKTTGT